MIGRDAWMSPESLRASLDLVKQGRVYDLSPRAAAPVVPEPRDKGEGGFAAQEDQGFAKRDEINEGGVPHRGRSGAVRDGGIFLNVVFSQILTERGVEAWPPHIGRAVLLDLTCNEGEGKFPGRLPISPIDLDSALDSQGTDVRAADTVLVRMGTGGASQNQARESLQRSGIGTELAQWAAERDIACWGMDASMTRAIRGDNSGEGPPMLLAPLVEQGIWIIENLYLEEVAVDHARKFMIIITPLKFRSEPGDQVRLLAVT